jgi:hypothetical protein
MRDLPGRLFLVIAASVAILVGIGYALMASGIAAPVRGNLGTALVPPDPGALATFLGDGRPAFVVRTDEAVHVVDARAPAVTGAPLALVAWCVEEAAFVDALNGGRFDSDGSLVGGAPRGLVVHPTSATDDAQYVIVGSEGVPAAGSATGSVEAECAGDIVRHEPEPGETFDPSVAADEEPPGWIWLEGRLEVIGGLVLLCDDADGTDCATGAAVHGIDPARLAAVPDHLSGFFIGRVGDDVIDELYYVPAATEGT